MGYLNCPICEKTELSNVQELQQKIATALSKSHSCPICSAEVYGLQAMHIHLATHIPIDNGVITNQVCLAPEAPGRSAHGTILTPQDHIPSLERLDIQDERYSPRTLIPQNSPSAISSATARATASTEVLEMTINDGSFQFNCDLCGLVFWSDHFLNLHKDIIHSKNKAFEATCKQCKSRFKDLEAYKGHVKEAHSDRRYICEQCPKSFKVKGGLLVHTRMYHDQSSPSTCVMCRKNFTSKARKELHDRRYHPAHASSTGETKTLLANLLSTTCYDDNSPGRYIPKIHQKLGRQSSSPAVLIQNRFIAGDESRDAPPSVVNSLCTFVKDVDMTVVADHRDGSNISSLFAINKGSKSKDKCLPLDERTALSNADTKVVTPMQFAPGTFGLISKNPVVSADIVCSNSKQGQRLYDNLIPLSQFEFDIKNNCMQFGAIKPNVTMNRSLFTLNNNYIGTVNNDNVAKENGRNFSFTQEIVQRIPLTNSFEGSPPEKNFYHPSVESSPEHSVRQMKEALEELFVESPVSSPSDGLLTGGEKILFSRGESPPPHITNDLAVKKNFILSRTSENKQWECEVCKKGFTTKYFLKKHKRLHTGETPYCCLECGKNFTFQQSYHKHVLYHSDDKPHICPHCGRAFKEMSTLHNHIRIHTGEKPFTCQTCGKSFRQRVSYLVHQRIHTGQMPYHCDHCNRSFRYKVSLRSHKCESEDTYEPPNFMGTDMRSNQDSNMLNLTSPEINSPCQENQFHVTTIIEGGLTSVNPVEENLKNQQLPPSGLRVTPNTPIGIPLLVNNSAIHACDVDFSSASAQNLIARDTTARVDLQNKSLRPQGKSESQHLNDGVSYLRAASDTSSAIKDTRMEIFQSSESDNREKQNLQKGPENLLKLPYIVNEQNISDCNILKPFGSLQNKEPHCIFWYENQGYPGKDLLVNLNEKGSVNEIKFEGEKDLLQSSLLCEPTQTSRLRCSTDDDDDQTTFLKSLFS